MYVMLLTPCTPPPPVVRFPALARPAPALPPGPPAGAGCSVLPSCRIHPLIPLTGIAIGTGKFTPLANFDVGTWGAMNGRGMGAERVAGGGARVRSDACLHQLSLNSEPLGGTLSRYCSFAYSALACFRMGMSGSASFQRAKKS